MWGLNANPLLDEGAAICIENSVPKACLTVEADDVTNYRLKVFIGHYGAA